MSSYPTPECPTADKVQPSDWPPKAPGALRTFSPTAGCVASPEGKGQEESWGHGSGGLRFQEPGQGEPSGRQDTQTHLGN